MTADNVAVIGADQAPDPRRRGAFYNDIQQCDIAHHAAAADNAEQTQIVRRRVNVKIAHGITVASESTREARAVGMGAIAATMHATYRLPIHIGEVYVGGQFVAVGGVFAHRLQVFRRVKV